jgi:hypothetical protein
MMLARQPILTAFAASALAFDSAQVYAAEFSAAAEVIEDRCMSCHDSDIRKGGVDLTPLLERANASYGEHTKLWVRVEKMVGRGKMPPKNKKPMEPTQKQAIQDWFHQSFVLREGKAHIGPTPLRQLTRYEFENTLESVLAISLKAPYRDTITGRIEVSKIALMVPSNIPGESGFDNDAHRLGKLRPPLNELADAANYALAQFRKNPAAIKAVLGRANIPNNASDAEVKQIISKFIVRAHRGHDVRLAVYTTAYHGLYQKHRQSSKDSSASLLHVFEMILVSPEFLYRMEQSQDRNTPYPVTGLELATRLAYFLWSSPPDAELLKLGRAGSLLKDTVLKAQIVRMLNSPKRITLSENFAGQWLGFNDLIANSEYLRDERWNRETYDEILFFIDELIRSNRSVLELVQSDWLYKRTTALKSKGYSYTKADLGSMNRLHVDIFSNRLSKSRNRKLRYNPPVMVNPQGDREGGIITSAAIMRMTASKTRTSPIRRGVWVLNTLIGKTMEAPEDVPPLEEAREALNIKRNPTVSELIKQHVSKAVCNACHKEIDPLGLGLENFAQFGEWRTQYPDKEPVIASGVMPNGKAFQSPREMKTLLLELYRDDIAENFARQLFAYALGRKLEPYDRVSLDQIVSAAKRDGFKTNTFIEEIVLSKQFRYRQDR